MEEDGENLFIPGMEVVPSGDKASKKAVTGSKGPKLLTSERKEKEKAMIRATILGACLLLAFDLAFSMHMNFMFNCVLT